MDDRSQNSNNGTLYGPTFSNELFLFDGTNDYIDLPNDIGYTTAVTAIAWFKRNGDAAGGYQIIFGGQELEISIPTGNGKIRSGTYNGSTRFVNEAGSGLLDNNWHQVAVSLDNATTTKIAYIDGVRVGPKFYWIDCKLIQQQKNWKIWWFLNLLCKWLHSCSTHTIGL